MDQQRILNLIDAEIAKLQQARQLLNSAPDALAALPRRRGRPAGSKRVAPAPIDSAARETQKRKRGRPARKAAATPQQATPATEPDASQS